MQWKKKMNEFSKVELRHNFGSILDNWSEIPSNDYIDFQFHFKFYSYFMHFLPVNQKFVTQGYNQNIATHDPADHIFQSRLNSIFKTFSSL